MKTIASLDDLPPFQSVLSLHGSFGLAIEYRDEIAAIEIGNKLCIIVATKNAIASTEALALRERLVYRGIKVSQMSVADIGVIRAIYESMVASQRKQNEKEVGKHTRIFDDLIQEAIDLNTSDIHIEIGTMNAIINMRINGLITKIHEWPRSLAIEICRLTYTVMASNESKQTTFRMDEPQECVIDRSYNGSMVKMRYAATPKYPSGLKVCMRLLALERYTELNGLEDLGYSKWHSDVLMKVSMSSNGAIITSGPTNSGKSTSMKYMIMEMDRARNHESSIYTIEDPPEWIIPGATQVPAKKMGAGGGMAAFVRLVLRMDPDIIMIGEIRDKETASVFQQTVQSGHKVFSTIHAESPLSIIARLSDKELGVTRSISAAPGFLSALIYQRLVPVTCKHCGLAFNDAIKIHPEVANRALEFADKDDLVFRNLDSNCKHCRGGISGQTICAEVIEPSMELLSFIRTDDDIGAIKYLRDRVGKVPDSFEGMDAMDHAISKMKNGIICPSIVEHIFERMDDTTMPGGEGMRKLAAA